MRAATGRQGVQAEGREPGTAGSRLVPWKGLTPASASSCFSRPQTPPQTFPLSASSSVVLHTGLLLRGEGAYL
jgi:hypothetical protein